MNAYCPDCETELDQATGICPACRWDPMIARTVMTPKADEPELSLTERYRGTQFDISSQQAAMDSGTHVSRGRTFVVVALVAGAGLYGLAVSSLGVF